MYQLKIELQAGKYEIWRRVLMPENASFQELHRVIQVVFDWQDSHLHECYTLADPKSVVLDVPVETLERKAVMVDLGARNAGWLKDVAVLDEKQVRLSEVFEQDNVCIYHYDFTDNWFHIIRLEKVVDFGQAGEANGPEKAQLTERCGTRPPEGVGGIGGFDDYMHVIADKKNPFREQMMDWVEGLEERELTIEEINKNL